MTPEECSSLSISISADAIAPASSPGIHVYQQAIAARLLNLLQKIADFMLTTEPLWAMSALAVVWVSVLSGGSYSWIGMIVASFAYPLRYWRLGHISRRTPFDIPIALFIAGAIVGTLYSQNLALSLGALQTCLAGVLVYYLIVNYARPRPLLIGMLVLACIVTPIVCLWGFGEGSTPSSGTNLLSSWANNTLGFLGERPESSTCVDTMNPLVHGLLLVILILSSILLGIVLFTRKLVLWVAAGIPCLVLTALGIMAAGDAFQRLRDGLTLEGRMVLWRSLVPVMRDHPWTGIGLGNFPLASQVSWITHPHNTYLEVYLNYGILGVLAAILVAVILIKLGWDILHSSRIHPWYGFGCGVLLAIFAIAIMGFFESAPMGIPAQDANAYYYAVSGVPWLLGGILIVIHQLLIKGDCCREMHRKDRFMTADEINRQLDGSK